MVLWDSMADKFQGRRGTVLSLRKCLANNFNGLSANYRTIFSYDPKSDLSEELKIWFDGFQETEFTSIRDMKSLGCNDFRDVLAICKHVCPVRETVNHSTGKVMLRRVVVLIDASQELIQIYEIFQSMKGDNTLNIKARWETEGNLTITIEEWDRICEHQWKMTCSPTWREFSWKNVTRFFCTPAQKSKYSIQSDCWRSCGESFADHFHIFWSCPSVVPFWRGVHSVLEAVFGVAIQFDFKTMYLTDIQELHLSKQDQYLIRILLVTSKKAITKKWLTNVIPTINEWIDLIYSVFIMERITFNFRGKSENFTDSWFKWIAYVGTRRPDFV